MIRAPEARRFTDTAPHDSYSVAVRVPARFFGSPRQHLDQAIDMRQLQDCFRAEWFIERGYPHRVAIDHNSHGYLRALPALDQ
jgi:hypothetical protein